MTWIQQETSKGLCPMCRQSMFLRAATVYDAKSFQNSNGNKLTSDEILHYHTALRILEIPLLRLNIVLSTMLRWIERPSTSVYIFSGISCSYKESHT